MNKIDYFINSKINDKYLIISKYNYILLIRGLLNNKMQLPTKPRYYADVNKHMD